MVRDTGDTPGDISGHHDDLVNALRDQVAQLQKQLEHAVERDHKNRRLLAAALERIPPQLEAPPEAAERPSKPPDDHEECG
jgi:hypothetical protein